MEAKKSGAGGPVRERVRLPEGQRCRQNFPIPSQLKQKRVYMAEPVDETCWAYMKLLRSQCPKRVYPVDPYVEVYRFRENLYGLLSESADGMGDVWMYLVVGPERAMLVDTGFGIGDLKGLCQTLIGGKELLVVNTHSHFDHAYGNSQFDRVYCHEYEAPSLRGLDSHLWDYLFQEDGTPIWAEFDRADLVPFREYEILPVPDGYTFDLGGGHEIELIHLGGHTSGHAAFLDKKNRVLFCGDDIISMRVSVGGVAPGRPYGEHATVEALRNNLARLAQRLGEFDHLFPGHFVTDIEAYAVQNMLAACERVLAAPFTDYTSKQQGARGARYFQYVEGLGTLAYGEGNVYMQAPATPKE